MSDHEAQSLRIMSWRPLVRYVDTDQAVVEVHLSLSPAFRPRAAELDDLVLQVQISEPDGFVDEHEFALDPVRRDHRVHLGLVKPDLWWPAGMGEQALYSLDLALVADGRTLDRQETTIGLTSVRPDRQHEAAAIIQLQHHPNSGELLINGRVWDYSNVVAIDAADERGLLPVSADSLMLVRGHYAPDLLYDAADRAGILLLQSVPIDPAGDPTSELAWHIDRLTGHPSLAGWFVGHLGDLAPNLTQRIRQLDPTHNIFIDIPGDLAA